MKKQSAVHYKPDVQEGPADILSGKPIVASPPTVPEPKSIASRSSPPLLNGSADGTGAISTNALDDLFSSKLDFDLAIKNSDESFIRSNTIKPEPKAELPKAELSKAEPSIVHLSKASTIDQTPPAPSLRVWKNPAGKEIEGTLIRVDGDTIEFRIKSGKVVKTASKFFCEEDQDYIKSYSHLK